MGRLMLYAGLLPLSWSVQAQGVGVPPAIQGGYTVGIYGTAQLASPVAPGFLSLAPVLGGCNWSAIYGDVSTQNYAYPEANATYWQASLPLVNPAGSSVRIDGQFADARFFSISLYDGSFRLLGTLSDYALLARPPGANPFLDKTRLNAGVRYGAAYTAYIVFGSAPPHPAPNTLYVPPQPGTAGSSLPSVQQLYLIYRVYVPGGRTASGEVPLPVLSIGGTPFSDQTNSVYCQSLPSKIQQDALYSVPFTPGQPGLGAPANPAFTLFKDSGIPGLSAGVNGDNQYMSATTTLPAGYLYLIRGKAPISTGAAAGVAEVRYWSICQNTSTSLEVIACVGDFQAVLDQDGYYNIVVSGDSAPPAYARGFNWMPFGPRTPGVVIYRQLLAADGFSGASGSPTMGSYTPETAYCPVSRFQRLAVQYPGSPKQIFLGCGGTAR